MVDTSNEWIMQRVGILQRHIAPAGDGHFGHGGGGRQNRARTARHRCRRAGCHSGLHRHARHAVSRPPPAWCRTGWAPKHAWGFDLVAACSGFIYGLTTAAHLVSAGSHKKVLVIGADTMSRIIDYTDRSTCVLFGDGAGAMLVEPAEEGETGFIDFVNQIDGSGGDYLKQPAGGSRMPASAEIRRQPSALRQAGRPAGFQIRGAQNVRMLPRSAGAQSSDAWPTWR